MGWWRKLSGLEKTNLTPNHDGTMWSINSDPEVAIDTTQRNIIESSVPLSPKRIIAKLYSSVKGSSRFSEMQDTLSRMRRLRRRTCIDFPCSRFIIWKMNATNQTASRKEGHFLSSSRPALRFWIQRNYE